MENNKTENHFCCKKEMVDLGDVQIMDMNVNFRHLWICGECGNLYSEESYSLDYEELKDLLENYKEEMKDTEIYKDLIKEVEK